MTLPVSRKVHPNDYRRSRLAAIGSGRSRGAERFRQWRCYTIIDELRQYALIAPPHGFPDNLPFTGNFPRITVPLAAHTRTQKDTGGSSGALKWLWI
jgi:hypothetical protein